MAIKLERTLFEVEPLNQLNLKYCGFVYKGSKRTIAHTLLQEINKQAPQAKYFYDLFGGGGSMSLCALKNGYTTFYNEIDEVVYRIINYALNNKKHSQFGFFGEEYYQFVDREEFKRIKVEVDNNNITDYNSIMLYAYSFSTDFKTYFCNRDKEKVKENIFNLSVHSSTEAGRFLDYLFYGNILEQLATEAKDLSCEDRRLLVIDVFEKINFINFFDIEELKLLDLGGLIAITRLIVREYLNDRLASKSLKEIKLIDRIFRRCKVEFLTRFNSIENINKFLQHYQLTISNKDYRDVKISTKPQDTILYCDIPYKNTSKYRVEFDYCTFYNWAIDMAKNGYNVFISEYDMPKDNFKELIAINHIKTIAKSSLGNIKTIEKLYTPLKEY